MNPTVSIIVPVYNVQDYLSRCIDSIIGQEYKDFELLLIDDGSTDLSGEICDSYAAKDARIKVVHKENSGVSDTRNLAIEIASGTYIQFMDSDDWITPDATKLLVRSALDYDCDLVIADFYRVSGEKLSRKGDIDDTEVMTRQEYAQHMVGNPADFYYSVLWNKLYKREIIMEHNIRMDISISWCEDFLFNLEYYLHAERFYALQAPIYYYFKRKGSLVSQSMQISKVIRTKLSLFEYYNQFYKNVYDKKDYDKRRLQVYRFLIDTANDGTVPPSILPGVKKLGKERTYAYPIVLSGEGQLFDSYRSRKIMERYLEVIAMKYDMTMKETLLLYHISQFYQSVSRKELADFMGVSLKAITIALQKLILKNYIGVPDADSEGSLDADKRTEKWFTIEILEDAYPIIADIDQAIADYQHIIFEGFTDAEMMEYQKLNQKMQDNMIRALNA